MAFNPQEHMLKLKGKDYLQVMWRLVWFREEHPDWSIVTNLISHDPETGSAVFKAMIESDSGNVLSTGYGSETKRDFGDYLEKAETKAVGRALAMLGYGTQFAPELDEEDRIVDSPVQRTANPNNTVKEVTKWFCCRCKNEIVESTGKDGKKYTPSQIVDISRKSFRDVYCCNCMAILRKEAEKRKESENGGA